MYRVWFGFPRQVTTEETLQIGTRSGQCFQMFALWSNFLSEIRFQSTRHDSTT